MPTSTPKAPPPLTADSALFLDFDGTLVALAETPEAIEVPSGLVGLLTDLHDWLGGAVAIVSGRQIDMLDRFLAPLRLPSGGEHGVQRRDAQGKMREQPPPDLTLVLDVANRLAGEYPDLLVERKHAAVALHYRRAPQLESLCHRVLADLVSPWPGLELLHGKSVFEVKPAGVNKGVAIAAFMQEAPFAGRTPFFAGDDTTDETGFAAVQPMGGVAIKVGSGETLALHHLESPKAVFEWLASVLPASQQGQGNQQ